MVESSVSETATKSTYQTVRSNHSTGHQSRTRGHDPDSIKWADVRRALSQASAVQKAEAEVADLPTATRLRNFRERTARHYWRVLALLLDALGVPDGCHEYIEAVISELGFDIETWTRLCDETLARSITSTNDEVAITRAVARLRKQRQRLNDWQEQRSEEGGLLNPVVIEHRRFTQHSDTGKPQTFSEYQLPLTELLRATVTACPQGTPKSKMLGPLRREVELFLRAQEGKKRAAHKKRRHSLESELKRARTLASDALTERSKAESQDAAINLAREHFVDQLDPEIREILLVAFGLNPSDDSDLPQIGHVTVVSHGQPIEDATRDTSTADSFCSESAPNSEPQDTFLSKNVSQNPGPPVGQALAEFMAKLKPEPPIERESSTPDRTSQTPRPPAPAEWLSLAELEAFDSRAGGHNKAERRFCCPICHGKRRLNAEHRSLAANTQTGVYHCHRCGASGKLLEFCGDYSAVTAPRAFPAPASAAESTRDERWRQWYTEAKPLAGSAGALYLERRGVSLDVATRAAVRFSDWYFKGSVLFALRNQEGDLVAMSARAITGEGKRTHGEKSAGVFRTGPEAFTAERVAITEAPIDALALAAAGLPAIALCGTSWPEWLLALLAGREVLLATDADAAGDECATKLARELLGLATFWRLRPRGGKDWAEIAGRYGVETVAALIEGENAEDHDSALLAGKKEHNQQF